MRTKVIIESSWDRIPEERVNRRIDLLNGEWRVISAHTNQNFFHDSGNASVAKVHYVTTVVLESLRKEEKTESDENAHERKVREMFEGVSVKELQLSNEVRVRVLTVFEVAGINTIGDLLKYSQSDLCKYRNFGKKSLHATVQSLGKLGLSIPRGNLFSSYW